MQFCFQHPTKQVSSFVSFFLLVVGLAVEVCTLVLVVSQSSNQFKQEAEAGVGWDVEYIRSFKRRLGSVTQLASCYRKLVNRKKLALSIFKKWTCVSRGL